MKKFWIAGCILAIMAAGSLFHYRLVERLGAEIIAKLEAAEVAVSAGNWEKAEALTEEASTLWETKNALLNTTLRHSDTDQVCRGLAEARGFLHHRDAGAYAAANARLRGAVRLLYETERLTLTNLL